MRITLSPQRSDAVLKVRKTGEKLTINGEIFDFSVIPEGAVLPATAVESDFIVGDISRRDGVLSLTLVLPHGADAPEACRFPAPLIDPPNGVLVLPESPVEEL